MQEFDKLSSGQVPILTPAQIEQIKRLSPAQQRALAERYGVSLPEQTGEELPIDSDIPMIIPRQPSELSTIEKKFQGKDEEGTQEERTKARRRIDEPEEIDDLQDKEIAEEIDRPIAFPKPDQAGFLIPDKDKRDEIKGVFEDFVRKPMPLEVSTEISQFGYNLFAGTATTFAPATDIPVPRDYIIGPDDEILVHLYGARQEKIALTVSRKGSINFPEEGPIQVSGLSFSKMTSLIEEIVKNKMIGVNVYITMGQLRSIRVFVLGDVESPGSYMISGLSTLSHALFVSGGIKKIGSLRNIQLRRSGKKIAAIDLYDFLLKGDTSGDVRLLPGDVVFVPPIGDTAGIAGEVKRPAIYELKGKTTAGELIRMAGGMLATGFKNMAQLERINEKGERIVIDFGLEDEGRSTKIQDGDLLKIFPVLDSQENIVYLSGNVKRPGKRGYVSGMKVSELVGRNTDLLPETYYSYALIEREAEGNREPELIRFDLGRVLEGDPIADLPLQPRDRVYIFNRSHFRQIPMVSIGGVKVNEIRKQRSAFKEPSGDMPTEKGVVRSPGFYELKKEMRVIDLILASGGLLRDAYMDQAELYRTDPLTKIVTVIKIDLNRALNRDDQDNLPLKDLDHLLVHSIWEFKAPYELTISGEVNSPGTFPFVEGARLSDLIFTGGSFTEKAYKKQGELTRYEVINGEKRRSQHLSVDLEAITTGDPKADLRLQPYDHLHIRRVTNWRDTERVTIAGEVRFPGVYPVEEGEKLADLIQRAGGFTEDAYLYAAKFTRQSIAALQKKEFSDMADKLETDVARIGASPAAAGQVKDIEKARFMSESLQQLIRKLRTTEPEGRLIIKLMEPDMLRESRYNLLLQNGDTLNVPKKPDSVLVLGEVYNPTAFLYERGQRSNDYIRSAGGLTELANRRAIYVIKADGTVVPHKDGFFSRIFYSGVDMGPGDIIVVPEKLKLVSGLELTKDITQVVYQLGLSAAAFKSVGVFD
ncbi:MAG: SLBB domain-containing protein [bacterium]